MYTLSLSWRKHYLRPMPDPSQRVRFWCVTAASDLEVLGCDFQYFCRDCESPALSAKAGIEMIAWQDYHTHPTTVEMGDTSARTLPPETTDKIIDYLHDIPTALVSSSLVQKSWTYRAQWWLYTKIFLRDRQAYASLLRLKSQPRTRAFLKQQCGHTTRLEITDDKDYPYAHAFPLPFINFFPVLNALAYHDAQWSQLHPDPTILDSLSTFSRVATLEFYACRFSKFRDFVRVICALRSLCDLTIVETNLGKASLLLNLNTIEPTITSLGKELRLSRLHARHLVSEGTSLAELLNWVSMTPSAESTADEQRIQTLVIHPHDLTSGTSFYGPLQALLRQLGSSLTTLDIPVLPQSTYYLRVDQTNSERSKVS